MNEGVKAAKGLLNYYQNRINEHSDDMAWQLGYEIAQKLVNLIEAPQTTLLDVEILLAYAESQDKSIEHPMWLNLVYVLSDYQIFLRGKNSALFN